MSTEISEKLQGNNVSNSRKDLLKYLEPAIIITLITSAMYFAGWKYTDTYLTRLSIDHASFDFPISYYLIKAFQPGLVAVLLILFAFVGHKKTQESFFKTLKGNFLIFIIVFILLSFGLYSDLKLSTYLFLFLALILAVLGFIATFKKQSLAHYFLNAAFSVRFIGFVFAILFCSMVAKYLGEFDAKNLIKGNRRFINTIKLTFKQESNIANTLEGKQLILIIHRNGNYYVIEQNQQISGYPRTIIIPESEVAFAEMRVVTYRDLR